MKLARRLDDDRVVERWVTVSDMTSVTVLRPSSDADDDTGYPLVRELRDQ